MAKRYYLCDIVGDGQSPDTAFRPAVADLGVPWVGSIPTDEAGRPLHTWCLVMVAASDHKAVRALPGVDPLPDFPLDGKVAGINQATKALMKAAVNRRGLNADALVDAKDGYREVIRGLGRALDPAFSEDNFDVRED